MFEFFTDFLTYLGLYVLVFYLYDNLKTPFVLLLSEVKELLGLETNTSLIEKYGSWAAITGSSDGIGKAYARELARRGLNVVLISRSLDKLQTVANEIESDFSVKTKIIVADFSSAKEACRQVEKQLDDFPIRILINNVGQSTILPGKMIYFTDEEIWSVIKTNIGPVTQLSRYLIKRLRETRQTGLILNVSSSCDVLPLPFGAVYCGTKAYVSSLTWALREEARPHGIEVELLTPYFVNTNIHSYSEEIRRGNIHVVDKDIYSRSAVNRLGKVDETTGHPLHDLQAALLRALPRRFRIYFGKNMAKFIIYRSTFRKLSI